MTPQTTSPPPPSTTSNTNVTRNNTPLTSPIPRLGSDGRRGSFFEKMGSVANVMQTNLKLSNTLSLGNNASKRSILKRTGTDKDKLKVKSGHSVTFNLDINVINFDETGAPKATSQGLLSSNDQGNTILYRALSIFGFKGPLEYNSMVSIIKRQIVVLCHLYTFWALPFDVVFSDSSSSSTGMAIDLVYLFAMITSFITVRKDPTTGKDIKDGRGILAQYMRRKHMFERSKGDSFFLDALALFPYYVVVFILYLVSNESLKDAASLLYGLSRLPQLYRIVLLTSFFREMEVSVEIDVRQTALVKYITMILGAAHWLGCIWWELAGEREFNENTWVYHYSYEFLSPDKSLLVNTTLEEYLAAPSVNYTIEHAAGTNNAYSDTELVGTGGLSQADKLFQLYGLSTTRSQYFLCIYWGFQSLTNLGYSDLIPDNSPEMLFGFFLCVFQVAFYAYILGTLFSYVVKKDQHVENYRKSVSALEAYCSNRELPTELKSRLMSYFQFQLSKTSQDNTSVTGALPPALVTKVASFKYRHIVTRSECFENATQEFLASIFEKLQTRFLMPNEVLFNKGDMGREVCFVENGELEVYADNEKKTFLRKITNDGTSSAMVGELSFFLTIPQPEMVTSKTSGDVTLLTLSKEDYNNCVDKYPECHPIVVKKLCAEMGLSGKGDELTSADAADLDGVAKNDNKGGEKSESNTKGLSASGGVSKQQGKGVAGDEDNSDETKNVLRGVLKKRSADALYDMIVAAAEGDVNEVKNLLLKGLDINTCDFDERTTLHLASSQGNAKVVELLLKEGADVHAVDRYGNNALHEAVTNNHVAVAEMLSRAGAELAYKNPAEHLTKAAGQGDLDRLNTLIQYGVDINAGDDDGRTSLHLSASEGNLNVVEFLLAHEAEANARDRWDHTPLDGAVEKGHDLVAAALFARGGEMNMKTAKSLFMSSARKGDLGTLKLLVENGMDIDALDYDMCSGLHVAAMADQPVAVDFLLSNKTTVNLLSRWNTSPLDEAIKSKSILCAKLLVACGGQTFVHHDPELLAIVNESTMTLADVRRSIAKEVNTQSERRREMHKLKQLHMKLVDDTGEAARVVALQYKAQEEVINKIYRSRLAMELPVFKESDLNFANFYSSMEKDTRCAMLRAVEAHGSSNKTTSGNNMGANSLGGGGTAAGLAMERFIQDKANTNAMSSLSFSSFDQVMLSLSKVEDGMNQLMKIFNSQANPDIFVPSVDSQGLACIFKLIGVNNVSYKDIENTIARAAEIDQEKNFSDGETRTASKRSREHSGKLITFQRFISDPLCVDSIAPEHDMAPSNEKIKRAFQIIRATFFLLDTDGDGEITLDELQQSKGLMGELSIGKELKNAFNRKETMNMGDLVALFANWTLCLDSDGGIHNDHVHVESGGSGSVSDLNSGGGSLPRSGSDKDLLDDLDGFEELEKDKKKGDDDDALNASSEVKSRKKKKQKRFRQFYRSVRRFLGWSDILQDEEEDMLDKLCGMMHGQVGTVFKRFDADDSGEIDREEFTALCVHAIGEVSDEEMSNLFNFFDGDKKGLITFEMLQKRLKDAENRKSTDKSQNKLRSFVLERNGWLHKILIRLRLLASFFYLLVVPYEICFIHTAPNADSDTSFSFFFVGWCVDITLYIDMISKFHLNYVNKYSVEVYKLRKIRKHYLAHGFAYDFIALIPIDILFYLAMGEGRLAALGYFRLLRLLRLVDIFNYFGAKRAKATKNRIRVELQILFVMLFACVHLAACIWFSLTSSPTDNTYLKNYHNTYDKFGSDKENPMMYEPYLLSLYWVTGTLTTMGQGGGDLMPQNLQERFFAIFLMVFNLSIYAYILGAISNLFMSADEAIVERRNEISALEKYISDNKLSTGLETEIRGAMRNQGGEGSGVSADEERSVFKKLSHSLQVEVSRYTCSALVNRVFAFSGCDEHFKDNVCCELNEENFAPGTFIAKENEPCTSLYTIATGLVEIIVHDSDDDTDVVTMEVTEGACIGEMSFFFNMRHSESARASVTSFVRVFALEKNDYNRLIKLYPHEEERITQNVLSTRIGGGGKKSGGSVSDGASSTGFSSDGGSSGGGSSNGDSSTDGGSEGTTNTAGGGQAMNEIAKAVEKKRLTKANEVNYALCLAAAKNNIPFLEATISKDKNFHQRHYFGRTPLHVASGEGCLEVVRLLVPLMDDLNKVDSRKNTCLMDAVRSCHKDVAKYLKANGASLNEDFASIELSDACSKGDTEKVDLLLRLGTNPSLNPPGRRRGASRRRRSASHMASSNNHIDCIKLLIKSYANLNTYDAWSGTPLADAVRHSHVEMQDVLRAHGAKLKEVGLCTAAAAGNIAKIKLMCDNGANINVTNYIGRTMLHLACSNKQPSVIEYLLSHKTLDLNCVDWYGGTPLDDAEREGHSSISVMIKEAGGLPSSHPSLRETVTLMQSKRDEEKNKAESKRKEDENFDKKRKLMLAKVSKIGQIAVSDMTTLRRLWDSLLLSLQSHTWKKQQALDKAPKPTLTDTLKHFRNSFRDFMKGQYALTLFDFYEVVRRYREVCEELDVGERNTLVAEIWDEYCDESSPSFVQMKPDLLKSIKEKMVEYEMEFDDPEGYVRFTKEKIIEKEKKAANRVMYDSLGRYIGNNDDANDLDNQPSIFVFVEKELEMMMMRDFMDGYFGSPEFKNVHKHPSGRTWRVLLMCEKALGLCVKIENELAVVLEEMVLVNEMKSMYSGSNGLDNLTKEGARDLKTNLTNFREKIEMICVITKTNFAKGFRKASVLHNQKTGEFVSANAGMLGMGAGGGTGLAELVGNVEDDTRGLKKERSTSNVSGLTSEEEGESEKRKPMPVGRGMLKKQGSRVNGFDVIG